MANQLDQLLENDRIHRKNRARASQILSAVEGMGIWEARELLGVCSDILESLTVSYKTPRSDTTP